MLQEFILNTEKLPNFSLQSAYSKLANSVKFYNKSLQQRASYMRYSRDGVKTDKTLVTLIPSSNIAIIDKSTLISQEVLANQNFMPNNAISQPKLFPGYLQVSPWAVGNTYFRPIFQRYLAKLYESGIKKENVFICTRCNAIQRAKCYCQSNRMSNRTVNA